MAPKNRPGERARALSRLSAAAEAVLSYLLSWMLFCYFHAPAKFFLILPCALFLGYLFRKAAERRRDRRLVRGCGVFSFLFSLALVAGGKISPAAKTIAPFSRTDLLYLAGFNAIFFPACLWISSFAENHPVYLREKGKIPRKTWAACSLVLFLCWVPFLVFYYPGNITPDSVACIIRAAGKTRLSDQQPVLFILMIRPFLKIAAHFGKDENFGSALFLLFQVAAMALLLGYLPAWMIRSGCQKGIVFPVMAYYLLIPVFPLYSVTLWKDVPFAGVMLLFLLDLFDIIKSGGKMLASPRSLFWFLTLSFFLCFLRHNGYCVVLVLFAVLAAVYRKFWKRFLPAFLSLLIAVPVMEGPVYRLCGIIKSPFAEAVGIPLQQIGYTVAHNGNLTNKDAEFLNRLLPLETMKKAYNPFSANGIKFQKNFDNRVLEENKAVFLKTWARMLPANWKEYGKAWLLETVGFWHPGTSSTVLVYGIPESFRPAARKDGIFPSDILLEKDRLESIRGEIRRWSEKFQSEIPLAFPLMNPASLFWMSALACTLTFLGGKKSYSLAFLPLLLLWGTYMAATPVFCEFRYMFSFSVTLPFSVLVPFLKKDPDAREGTLGESGEIPERQSGPKLPDKKVLWYEVKRGNADEKIKKLL